MLNLHNHTYEVENDMHDLKGTLARIPDVKLGPDLNWLVRAGVDPVSFIKTYGKQIVFLHLRDQKADGKWSEAMGEGNTDYVAIGKALQEVKFSGRRGDRAGPRGEFQADPAAARELQNEPGLRQTDTRVLGCGTGILPVCITNASDS